MLTNPNPVAVLWTVTKICILSLIALVGILIVLTSLAYFPPKFSFGFLRGREAYFYSWYAIAFYVHVITSPLALFLGLMQSIDRVRNRHPKVHRSCGYIYVLIVLLFATPSGLAMSIKADGGTVAVIGFAALAIATAFSTWQGFSAARCGRFVKHRQWMTRSYLLICSAVLLRFMATLTNQFELNITYGAMAWLSWLPSLMIYEIFISRQTSKIAG